MKALTAQVIADEGEIEILGYRLPGESKQARAEMGVVPQLDNLDTSLTVRQNLLVFTYLYRVPARDRQAAIDRALGDREPRRPRRLQGRRAERRDAPPAADRAGAAAPAAAAAARRADRRPRPPGPPGAVGADRPAALGGGVDPDEHALHRGGRAALRHRDDHVPRPSRGHRRAAGADPPPRRHARDRGLRAPARLAEVEQQARAERLPAPAAPGRR